MEKRGQFYLIGTIIIILIISGLLAASNRAIIQPKQTRFYDLSQDYEAETSKVIDYGIYNKYTPEVNISKIFKNITDVFKNSTFAKDPNVNLVFIYGNKNGYSGEQIYPEIVESSWGEGGRQFTQQTYMSTSEPLTGIGQTVNVTVAGNEYSFNLTEKENFYFVIQTTTPANESTVVVRK